jgi:hypothetical protein
MLGQHQDLPTVMAAPALLANLDFGNVAQAPASRPVPLVQGAYSGDFMAQVKALHINVNEVPVATAAGLRGTLAAIAVDPKTGRRSGANQPGLMVFSEVQ